MYQYIYIYILPYIMISHHINIIQCYSISYHITSYYITSCWLFGVGRPACGPEGAAAPCRRPVQGTVGVYYY